MSGSQNGKEYWREINVRVNQIIPDFNSTKDLFKDTLLKQRDRAIQYWTGRKKDILNMEEMEAKNLIIDIYYNISNKLKLIQNKHFFFD